MKAVIFLNGEYRYERKFIQEMIDEEDMVFCADGGANYAFEYGIVPDYIMGDLDSIRTDILHFYEKKDVVIEKYSPEKDYTDFELILHKTGDYEKEGKVTFEYIYVLGGLGKRIDMTLSNLHLMEEYKNMTFFSENEEIFYREASFSLKNRKGDEISIIPLGEFVGNLTLKGFKYGTDNVDIERKSSRLVSNIITSDNSRVEFGKGKIIVVLRKK